MRVRDMKQVAPGLYEDTNGALHINVPELLTRFRFADTPENRKTCVDAIRAVVKEQWGKSMPITEED